MTNHSSPVNETQLARWLERARGTQCCDPVIDGMIGSAIEIIDGLRRHAQCALTDDQQYALERMAAHDPRSSGLAWDSDRLLLESAAQAAKDVLSSFSSTECWTEQDIAEAKAEAKELYDYFNPTVTSTEREMTPTEKQLVEKALRDSGKTIETLTSTGGDGK